MHGLVQFPTVIGGVVAVVNVDGVKAGDLVLDGPTLAKIFLGEIKSWNDAALRKLNPNVKLPSQGIAVVIAPTAPARRSSSPIISPR
jgi:phosphate transport system substrate-binding protein